MASSDGVNEKDPRLLPEGLLSFFLHEPSRMRQNPNDMTISDFLTAVEWNEQIYIRNK